MSLIKEKKKKKKTWTNFDKLTIQLTETKDL